MIEAPLAVAFVAGLIAIMNPCGFAMLPAYLSYFMGSGENAEVSRPAALRRALLVGGVMSLSFLVIVGVTGVAIMAGFRAVIDWIPYIALAIGLLGSRAALQCRAVRPESPEIAGRFLTRLEISRTGRAIGVKSRKAA